MTALHYTNPYVARRGYDEYAKRLQEIDRWLVDLNRVHGHIPPSAVPLLRTRHAQIFSDFVAAWEPSQRRSFNDMVRKTRTAAQPQVLDTVD